ICFNAHMGCWEASAAYVTTLYPRVAFVVRPLDNPRLEELILAQRGFAGADVIASHDIFKRGLKLLRLNGILGILIDQNLHKGGVFVNFFGRLAATTNVVSVLARRTGAVVLPLHSRWRNGRIQILCEGPFP